MARVARAVVGALVLLVSALLTLGTSLAAPLGMAAAWVIARRRGRSLTRRASWLGAVAASSLAIALLFATLVLRAPNSVFREVQAAAAAADTSARARPPAWLARIAPQAAQRPDPLTGRFIRSRAFTLYVIVGVLVMLCALLGTVAGTVGWGGALLLRAGVARRRAA